MHATIENAHKRQRIYTPKEWEMVIIGAYQIRTRNTDHGDIVNWFNMKWLMFEKSAPHTILYKHRIQSEGFMKLVVSTERGRRMRPETIEKRGSVVRG